MRRPCVTQPRHLVCDVVVCNPKILCWCALFVCFLVCFVCLFVGVFCLFVFWCACLSAVVFVLSALVDACPSLDWLTRWVFHFAAGVGPLSLRIDRRPMTLSTT